MSYVLTAHKQSTIAWSEIWAHSLEKPKRRKKRARSRKSKAGKTNAWNFVKALMENIAEGIVIAAFCYALFQGYMFLTTSPFFNVSSVTISGNAALDLDQLLNRIEPVHGENIFTLDSAAISRRLNEHPWIRSVSIERHLPDGIRLHIEERMPYTRIQLGEVYLMDNYGVLMGHDSPAYRHLPLVTGVKSKDGELGRNVAGKDLIACLKIMYYLNRLPFFQKDPIDRLEIKTTHRVVFITRNNGTKIIINPDTMIESFENFKIVLELIGRGKESFEYIDLSFKDKVVVKPGQTREMRFQKIRSS